MKIQDVLFGVACGVAATSGLAYETTTHATITHNAVAQSRITTDPMSSALFRDLGLTEFASTGHPAPLGDKFVHLQSPMETRAWGGIETTAINRLGEVYPVGLPWSIGGWLISGAIREDDNLKETPESDEPWGVFNRVLGHFFDPQLNRGIQVGGVPFGSSARSWALASGAIADLRFNYYGIANAREAMWRALTLTTPTSSGLTGDVVPPDWTAQDKEGLRRAYWATTLRSLGHVVHLLQDMAQPQHTRNDIHTGLACVGSNCLGGHTSFYEKYAQARTLELDVISLPSFGLDQIRVPSDQLQYGPYPTIALPTFEEYFAVATGSGNATGRGLANYSNRNFYTFGTNAGEAAALQFPSPHPTAEGLGDLVDLALTDLAGNPLMGAVTFKVGSAPDYAADFGDQNNVRLTSHGLWNQFLLEKVGKETYTLNVFNYDDQADRLIRRAVGYSAGLIDHFFRGKLSIGLPTAGAYAVLDQFTYESGDPQSGFKKFRATVENKTDPVAGVVQSMSGGKLVAVLKFRRSTTTYDANLSGECSVSTMLTCRGPSEEILVSTATRYADGTSAGTVTLAPGVATEFLFEFDAAMPLNVTDVHLQVVYRGALGGEEDAVAVGTRNISEPTYITVMNASNSIACAYGTWQELNPDGSFPEGELKTTILNNGHALPGGATSGKVSVAFKKSSAAAPLPPFPSPLGPSNPAVSRGSLEAGEFVRAAVLSDDDPETGNATWWVSEVIGFPNGETDFPMRLRSQEVGKVFPAATPQAALAQKELRGIRTHQFVWMYRSVLGEECLAAEPASFADVAAYPAATQRAADIAY